MRDRSASTAWARTLESAYRDALVIELLLAGFDVQKERRIAIEYRGEPIGNAFRLDIVVEGQLVIEVKGVEKIHRVHIAQVLTYLKLANLPCGLLMNFNVTALRLGVKRLLHPDLFATLARDGVNEDNPVVPTTFRLSATGRRGESNRNDS